MMGVFSRQAREWSINDVAKLVRTHPRFSMLNEADALALVQHMHPVRLDAGKVLFREGRTDSHFMAIILEGEAKAEAEGGGLGDRVPLARLKEGDLVGEQGILQETPRTATVTAITDMMLAAIDGAKFEKLTKAKPQLGCVMLTSMLRTVTQRLWDQNQRLYVLADHNKKLKKELDLELAAAKSRTSLKEIPPMEVTQSMFEPMDPKPLI